MSVRWGGTRMVDFVFPSMILLLKFLFRVAVNREFDKITFLRTLLLFPIDVTFVSFTFMAAMFVRYNNESAIDPKAMMAMVLSIVVLAIIATICAFSAESAFVRDEDRNTILLWGVAVVCSLISIVLATISVGLV